MGPLLKQNQLPNFSKLIEKGASGELLADPAFSPPSWTSIATGKRQEKHGVYKFADASKRRARYIWDVLGDFNISVGVVNWQLATPDKLNGFMYVRRWYTKEGDIFYPETIESEVKEAVSMVDVPSYRSVEAYKFWNTLDKNFIRISMHLINRYRPFFMAMGFTGADAFQHKYWDALEPQYFDISQKEAEERGELINDYYKKIDKFLDYFIKNNYTIIFVSDHGHCRNDIRSGLRIAPYYFVNLDPQSINFLVNRMLAELGLLTFISKPEGGAQIDFSKSQAYFYNDLDSGLKGIKINRKVVEKDGIKELRKRIFLLIKEAMLENKEKQFVDAKEHIADEDPDFPDVIFNLSPIFKRENLSFEEDEAEPQYLIFHYLLDKDGRKLTRIILEDREYNLGDFINFSRTGVHETRGVIIMAGKNIRKNQQIRGAAVLDITPTILYLLDLPIATDMDGRVLVEALEPELVKKRPIKYIETYETEEEKGESEEEKEVTIIKERLRSLGYVQ